MNTDNHGFILLDENGVVEYNTRLEFNGGEFTILDLPPQRQRVEIHAFYNIKVVTFLMLTASIPLVLLSIAMTQ